MRVLMLGWEFPPFMSGGLGTACYGLTRALSRQRTQVTFVLPKAVGMAYTEHVKLLTPQSSEGEPPGAARAAGGGVSSRSPDAVADSFAYAPNDAEEEADQFRNVTFKAVPATFTNPYGPNPVGRATRGTRGNAHGPGPDKAKNEAPSAGSSWRESTIGPINVLDEAPRDANGQGDETHYHGDLVQEARRYADLCVDLARSVEFDVVHAHDWLTYPAGMAVAAATGRPLVVHVHSTEFDRSGEDIHQELYDIERRGFHAAARVLAVSHLTRTLLENRYGVEPDKIEVVYNGIQNALPADTPANASSHPDPRSAPRPASRPSPSPSFADNLPVPGEDDIMPDEKIVLFLGRMTMQKGPEYFIDAAKRVLAHLDRVKFVMAGSGDKARELIETAAREGIGHKVLFTGFLRGEDVARVYKMADVFVMPSVSEPFGIAALEAISHDVPVILSRQSGVSEVVHHALKVDFWDTREMANKIIALLRHPPLAGTLRSAAHVEVHRLTWDSAAARCRRVYQEAVGVAG